MAAIPTSQARAGLVLRQAAERFHSRLDWLDSWHTFSFANHLDPAWMGFGPLRVINDDIFAAGRGFGLHPHRDMEIITVMVEGQLTHRDSLGHTGLLQAGEVQRMSTGTGLVHSEINASDQPCRLLQIWIEPSRSGIPPSYEQKPFAIGSGWTALIDPQQQGGALAIQRPVRLWRARPQPGQGLELPLAADRQGWIQLIDGGAIAIPQEASAPPLPLQRGDGLGFNGGQLSGLTAGEAGADLLLFELR